MTQDVVDRPRAAARSAMCIDRPDGRRLHVREADTAAELLDARWDDLVARQPLPAPTSSAAWLRGLLELERGRPLLLALEQDGRFVAAGAFGVRKLGAGKRPRLASWLADDPFWYSPDLLVDPRQPELGAALIEALFEQVDAVHLAADAGGTTLRALAMHAPWLETSETAEGYVLPLPPPRGEYAEKRTAYNLRRATRLGCDLLLQTASEPGSVEAALERLFALHRERWRGRTDALPTFAATDAIADWHRRVVGALAHSGGVRIVELFEDGVLVGSVLGLIHGRGALFHTMAVHPGARLRGPGHVILLELANQMRASGATTLDLGWGAGDRNGPKARLGPDRVQVVRMLAARDRRYQPVLEHGLRFRSRVKRAISALNVDG
jgi:CelD/BcsL family acetyltransferase involved in cellulose biosynthesis